MDHATLQKKRRKVNPTAWIVSFWTQRKLQPLTNQEPAGLMYSSYIRVAIAVQTLLDAGRFFPEKMSGRNRGRPLA